MKYDGLIFDLDGTFWDTCQACADTWNIVLKEQNIAYRTITLEDMKGIMGKTHAEIQQMFFASMPHDQAKSLMHTILMRENDLIPQGGWHLYQGVEQGLAKLSKHYRLFIVSNCQEGYLQSFNQVTGLVDQYIQDYEYIGRTGNPKGQNIQSIIQRNQLHCPIYIGDTTGDQKAAEQAGIDFAYVSYGFGEIPQANPQFDDFDALTEYFIPSA